jgi:hypothetical protein
MKRTVCEVIAGALLLAGCFEEAEPPQLRVTASADWCPETCAPLDLPLGFSGVVSAEFINEVGTVVPASNTIFTWEPHSVIDVPDANAAYDLATVVGVAPGTGSVTVRNEQYDLEDAASFVVHDLVSITVELVEPELTVGDTVDIHAMGDYGGSSYDLAGSVAGSAAWTSDAPDVATVENGVLTGVAPGEATITAEFLDLSGSTTVTVVE